MKYRIELTLLLTSTTSSISYPYRTPIVLDTTPLPGYLNCTSGTSYSEPVGNKNECILLFKINLLIY